MKEMNKSYKSPGEKNYSKIRNSKTKAKHKKSQKVSLINIDSDDSLETETNSTLPRTDKSFKSKNIPNNKTTNINLSDSIKTAEQNGLKASNEEQQNKNVSPKMNAFQVLMESRHKVIGSNSSGKELALTTVNSDDEKDKQEKLVARKKTFTKWAEKKGASKRKREEDEKDEIIKHKMNGRAKRLKKLLQVDKNDENFEWNNDSTTIKQKRKRIKKLSCSSDSDLSVQESLELEKNNSPAEINLSVEEFFCEEDVNKLKNRKGKSSLSARKNNSGIIENREEKLLPSDENVLFLDENPKNNISPTKKSELKNGLLGFFQIVDKTKKCIENEFEQKNSRGTFIKEIKKQKTDDHIKKHKSSKSKVKKRISNEGDGEIVEVLNISRKSKSNTKPKKREKKEVITDESSQESFSPTIKSWKMKIRVKMDQQPLNDEKVDDEAEKLNSDPVKEENPDESHISVSSVSEDDELQTKEPVKSRKIAPVFVKAAPKPKIDPEVLEARRQFLLSGTPSSIKKLMIKQQSLDEKEVDVFPLISHIQQKSENPFWNLPRVNLELNDFVPLEINVSSLLYQELTNSKFRSKLNIQTEVDKVDKLKVLLNKIKQNNPDYPVYKSFKSIYAKSGKNTLNSQSPQQLTPTSKKKRGRPKKIKVADVEIELQKTEDLTEFTMWTEKYRPKCSGDILGNIEAVKNLKKWLVTWKNFSQEINSRKKRKNSSSSEFDFESTDCDSNSSTRLPGNTVILGGPCGSGKSSAVYAVCEELEFNVIEINASSRRTGKKLMQELQEATQSHQVRKNEAAAFANLFDPNRSSKQELEVKDNSSNPKMCVLLVEDIDLVFEQDDGFICALGQLINTSKRPIILTTTDYTSVFVQKFLTDFEYIPFLPLPSSSLGTWLQILCLIEGKLVEKDNIATLLNFNKGDIRKTVLELQFWILSGGQLVRNDMPIKLEHQKEYVEEKYVDDEDMGLLKDDGRGKNNTFTHKDCLRSFQIFENHKPFHVPYYLDLGLLWWNIPIIFEMSDFAKERIDKISKEGSSRNKQYSPRKKKLLVMDKIKLDALTKFYDSLSLTDISFRKLNYYDGLEPNVKNYFNGLTDTLELGENRYDLPSDHEFTHEITHTLIDMCIQEYNGLENTKTKLDICVPGKLEKRWRAKHHVCEDVFRESLPLSSHLDRKSFALDYLPEFRTISRSENQRAANNTKRGNRFRSYFKDLGINCNDSTSKIASSMLQEHD